MKCVITILVLASSLVLASQIEAKDWRGIVPLHSTRADVVRALGQGDNLKNPGTIYKFENESVVIAYPDSLPEVRGCIRQLAPDLVLTITIFPKVLRNLEDFGLSPDALRTIPTGSDSFSTTAAFDEDNGLVVSYSEGGQEIVYLPSKTDRPACADFYGDLSGFVIKRPPICFLCPTISVTCAEAARAGDKLTFTTNVVMGATKTDLSPIWTIDEGLISFGQGTFSITVDSSKVKGTSITATVEVNGIDPSCSRTASCTTLITKRP